MNKAVREMQNAAESWNASDVIGWALAEFGQDVAVASSFGAEDVVLIDLAIRENPDVPVFTLDTDFLFPETYALIGKIEQRYGISVERRKPALTPDEQRKPVWRGVVEPGSGSLLPAEKSSSAKDQTEFLEGLDHGNPARSDAGTCQHTKDRMGPAIRPRKDKPAGRLVPPVMESVFLP